MGFEGQSYLAKWSLLGTVIGVVAGLGAALFYYVLEVATELFLVRLGGHTPPLPVGEGGGVGSGVGCDLPPRRHDHRSWRQADRAHRGWFGGRRQALPSG